MASVGVGIVGTGMMGRIHADAARRAGAQIVAISGSSIAKAKTASETWANGSRALEVKDLLTDPAVDVVHLCVPNDLHEPLSLQALRAGKNVVCEKPLALDVAGARAVTDMARRTELVAAVPFIYRYHPLVAEARARVRNGSAGNIHLIHGSYLQDWLSSPEDNNWRVDDKKGGASRAFADIGSHWCDLIEWVSGHRIQEVSATAGTAFKTRKRVLNGDRGSGQDSVPTEDIACVNFRTDLGAVGSLVVSQVSPGRKNRLSFEISASNTSMAFDQEQPESLWVGARTGNENVVRDPDNLSPEAAALSTLPGGHPQGYHDCFRAFVSDVYSSIGREYVERMPTFQDGARTASITEAVLASATAHKWVDVNHAEYTREQDDELQRPSVASAF